MSNHAPEPWHYDHEHGIIANSSRRIAKIAGHNSDRQEELDLSTANALHIVNCVNAFTGMADTSPEFRMLEYVTDTDATIARLRTENAALREALQHAVMWARGYYDATHQITPWKGEAEVALAKVTP